MNWWGSVIRGLGRERRQCSEHESSCYTSDWLCATDTVVIGLLTETLFLTVNGRDLRMFRHTAEQRAFLLKQKPTSRVYVRFDGFIHTIRDHKKNCVLKLLNKRRETSSVLDKKRNNSRSIFAQKRNLMTFKWDWEWVQENCHVGRNKNVEYQIPF
jgi:hypothetical protein